MGAAPCPAAAPLGDAHAPAPTDKNQPVLCSTLPLERLALPSKPRQLEKGPRAAVSASLPPAPATGTRPGEKDAPELWTCPICCADLGSNREEIGALTYQGRRVEQALYHLGCVSMMLIHGVRQGHGSIAGPRHKPKVNGHSPVTRKAVDGFLPIPSFKDHRQWVQFINWKHGSSINAAEVLEVSTLLLPDDRCNIERFMHQAFQIVDQDLATVDLPASELEARLVPYLEELAEELQKRTQKEEQFAPMFTQVHANFGPSWDNVGKRSAGPDDSYKEAMAYISRASRRTHFVARHLGPNMRSVCRCWRVTALMLLAREVCCLLEAGTDDMVSMAKYLTALVTGHSDERVRCTAGRLLEDARLDVRQQGLSLLACVSTRGEADAFAKVSARFRDISPPVREAAILALVQIAEKGDQKAVRLVAGMLTDADNTVRRAAEQALEALAEPGDRCTVEAMAKLAVDAEPLARKTALRVLAMVSARGDSPAMQVVLSALKDSDPSVRRVALVSSVHLAAPGDKHIVKAITSLLRDRDQDVRDASIRTLASVTERDETASASAVHAVLGRLKDEQASIRITAVSTLRGMARKGDQKVVRALLSMFEDNSCSVQSAAISALAHVADRGDQKTLRALHQLLSSGRGPQDIHPQVRRAAEIALEELTLVEEPGMEASSPAGVRRSWLNSLSLFSRR